MALTDTAIRNAKPSAKPRKLSDEKGLHLLIKPAGGKYWRWSYRFAGKQKTLAIGVYPDVSLKQAHDRRDDARKLLADGIDPAQARKVEKREKKIRSVNTFEAIAREWHTKHLHTWVPKRAERILSAFERDVFPMVGTKPIAEVEPPDILDVLKRIEARGALNTAHDVRSFCGRVFRYAIAHGIARRDATADLKGALPPIKVTHHAAITTPVEVSALLRDLDGYDGNLITRCALRLMPLLFVRPGELRNAAWSEFDLEAREWRIPAGRMKMGTEHLVPLSEQAITILRDLEPLTGHGRLVFPGVRSSDRPMSENTVNAALRRLGYTKDQMTGHGFRSIATTLLNEQGWTRDAIERQMAHAERDSVRAAYNRAEHLPERGKMMQAWANYLDGLCAGADVVPIGRRA